jgi:predicted alpha/beta-hydrolase family hydrolase
LGRRIVFAPGAGAPSTSPWMTAWTRRLRSLGEVTPIDYPYAKAGRKAPDRLPKLIAAHRAEVEALGGPDPVVLIGKSMGSRVGCHVSLEVPVTALVCFGYPLVGTGKKQPVRDEVLKALRTPILFVTGTRDPLCPLDRLEAVRGGMEAANALFVVEGGDHSLQVRKDQERVDQEILAAVRGFLDDTLF